MSPETKIGDKIQLAKQEVTVVACEKAECGHLMVNIDANQLALGDLAILKKAGVRISNPETEAPICINCEHRTFGRAIADFFTPGPSTSSDDDSDDDSSFFHSSGGFLGGSGFGGFSSGGFGGFGGGGFSGGGASRGF